MEEEGGRTRRGRGQSTERKGEQRSPKKTRKDHRTKSNLSVTTAGGEPSASPRTQKESKRGRSVSGCTAAKPEGCSLKRKKTGRRRHFGNLTRKKTPTKKNDEGESSRHPPESQKKTGKLPKRRDGERGEKRSRGEDIMSRIVGSLREGAWFNHY